MLGFFFFFLQRMTKQYFVPVASGRGPFWVVAPSEHDRETSQCKTPWQTICRLTDSKKTWLKPLFEVRSKCDFTTYILAKADTEINHSGA